MEEESLQLEMLAWAYGRVETKDVAAKQDHLTTEQQNKLRKILDDRKILFDGKLGQYPHKKFHIESTPDAKLLFQHPCPMPFHCKAVCMDETKETTSDGML